MCAERCMCLARIIRRRSSPSTFVFSMMIINCWIFHLLVFIIVTANADGTIRFADPLASFDADCSDHRYKPSIECHVEADECNEIDDYIRHDDENGINNRSHTTNDYPSMAHDFRVQTFIRSITGRYASTDKYQLVVDISWQPPMDNSTLNLRAFSLRVLPEGSNDERCYLFNLTRADWTDNLVIASPRFRFVTESLFDFDRRYNFDLQSLPRSWHRTTTNSFLQTRITMPKHPEQQRPNTSSVDCSTYTNPYASRWVAGFRKIYLYALARTIHIVFVGAPEHYCFEAYEVRLLDETGIELLHHAIINRDSMNIEIIDNQTVVFGEYNFTNLQLDRYYVPAVLPIERASDGRCLCPVNADADPYSEHIVCSCLAAEWKKVKLERLNPIPFDPCTAAVPPLSCRQNITATLSTPIVDDTTSIWSMILLIILTIVIVAIAIIFYILYITYRRYRSKGKTVRIRFISDRRTDHTASNGNAATVVSSTNSRTPLVVKDSTNNVLIVYSHDCPAHEAVVTAFAEYLRDVLHVNVIFDAWNMDEIGRNRADYLAKSTQIADKILLINSIGAHYRYQCKLFGGNGDTSMSTIERVDATSPIDDLFLCQLDYIIGHPALISTRFVYSDDATLLLGHMAAQIQYVIPDNMTSLITAIVGDNNDLQRIDHTNSWLKLTKAIDEMQQFQSIQPNWFQNLHQRVDINSSAMLSTSRLLTIEQPTLIDEQSELTMIPITVAPVDDEKRMLLMMNGDSGVVSDIETTQTSIDDCIIYKKSSNLSNEPHHVNVIASS